MAGCARLNSYNGRKHEKGSDVGFDERVLVLPTAALGDRVTFVGFRPTSAADLDQVLSDPRLTFLNRSVAEGDPSFKQLVPYMVLRAGDGVFWYQRGAKGTETRLHALGS